MPNWTTEQKEAITKKGTNIIVSASAGSGKTAVLTERVIQKLKDGVKIDELLILTFTKAAAKEMKDRIKDRIIEEGLTENLKLLEKSYITTFDSYALSIVRKYHYILNLSSNVSIEEGGILDLQTKKILDEIMEEKYETEDPNFIQFITDFCTKDDNLLKDELLNIYQKLDLKVDKEDYLNSYLETYYNIDNIKQDSLKYLNILKNKIASIKYLLGIIRNYADENYIEELTMSIEPLLEAKTYDEIRQNAFLKLPKLPNNSDDMLKQIKEMISKKLENIQELCNFDSEEEMINLVLATKNNVSIILDIIKELDTRMNVYKNKNELFSFNDIAKMSIKVLRENNSIREELKELFEEIMIDEYQDTSDIQEEFISLIENNNVYMVGDVKQSIYRFRNANPLIFKNKYDNYKNNKGGIKIELSKNFRSREEVINDINDLFTGLMDDKIGGADYYNEHSMIFGNEDYRTKGKHDFSNQLEILNYEYDKDTKYSKEEIEAFTIARDIQNKINNKYLVFDKTTKVLRPITYNDFVILMGKSANFTLYKQIFEYLNIPLTISRDENLLHNSNINLIKNLCELILLESKNDYSSIYDYDFLSIGRSYLFEMDDNDLFQIVSSKDYSSPLNDLIKDMTNYINESLHVFLEILFKKCNIYEKMIKVGNIEENTVVLDYLKTISLSLENIGYTLDDFVIYLDDLEKHKLDLKYSPVDYFSDSVKIMTIHGSKGLEYPICYYASLHDRFNIRELSEKILLSDKIVIPYINGYYRRTMSYYLLKEQYMEDEISERIRLFYVALTRAREKMIIVTSLSEKNTLKENDIVLDRLNYKSFLDMLCSMKDTLEKNIIPINIDNLNITRDYQFARKSEFKPTKDEEFDVVDFSFEVEELEDKHYSKEQVKLLTNDIEELMTFGTKIHEILELLDFKNPNYDDINLPSKYIDKIKSFLNSELFEDNLQNIYKEYEFIDDENLGTIDLILEYEDTLKVVDYKLKNIDDNAYIEQLKGYERYLKKISNKKIELYLYSILNKQIKKI